MVIKVSKYIVNKCEEFANQRMGGSADLYKKRGEMNQSKIYQDILNGAIAEWAAFRYLTAKGFTVSKPDMTIYEKKNKSYAADLEGDDLRFHVKAQSKESAAKYGLSWLLQKTDKLLKEPALNEYFVFAEVDGSKVEIKGVIQASDIVERELVGQPKVPRYQHSKLALYFDEIKEGVSELWQI